VAPKGTHRHCKHTLSTVLSTVAMFPRLLELDWVMVDLLGTLVILRLIQDVEALPEGVQSVEYSIRRINTLEF
jgi:hypothetical protein